MQPFVAVGLKLKEYGHRVRIATHAELRGFVEQFGLEFYPLGGDPQVLADFAVQSKGGPPDALSPITWYHSGVYLTHLHTYISHGANTATPVMLLKGKAALESAGVFPRGLGQVSKLRQQIKAYVAGQLDACTQPDPEHPKAHFKVSPCPKHCSPTKL